MHIVCICIKLLQVANKKPILETIVFNEALNKRRIYLDAIASGLEVMGIKALGQTIVTEANYRTILFELYLYLIKLTNLSSSSFEQLSHFYTCQLINALRSVF